MVSDSKSDIQPTDNKGGGGNPAPHSRQEEAFMHRFPYYLSIGMTAEQYWDGDPSLPIYYREADKLRADRENQQAWLQGMYVYDAISRLAPILSSFGKKGTKPEPYVEEPYPLDKEKAKEAEKRKEKKKAGKALNYLRSITASNNKRFKEGGKRDGNND